MYVCVCVFVYVCVMYACVCDDDECGVCVLPLIASNAFLAVLLAFIWSSGAWLVMRSV